MGRPEAIADLKTIYVPQGEYALSDDAGVLLSTVLGSCIATCLFDPDARIGGINHFLLPDSSAGKSGLYGVHLMELLINGLMKAGAQKSRLRARIHGGANMLGGISDVGVRNAAFARSFLATEGIPLISEGVGGSQGRRLRFVPTTGEAFETLVAKVDEPPKPRTPKPKVEDDIELF